MGSPTISAESNSTGARAGSDRRIVVHGLTRRFGDTIALRPLELTVGPGGVTGLLGPNGSGKSTLMRILTGLVRPDAGEAVVDGVPLKGDGTAIRRRITYSPGEMHLYGEMRADEHLAWLLRGRGKAALGRALTMARGFELPLRARVRGYSHGMKRQLMFCAAMSPDASVRILDEPTDGLDPSMRSAVLAELRAEARRGTTVLLSSHHLGEVDSTCGRLVFMNEGRVIADETASEVRDRAARLVRVTWPEGTELDGITERLALDGVESVRRDGASASVFLKDRDPRPFFAALARLDGLPAPSGVEHGKFSLQDLYRELYGVEAC